MWWNTVLEYLKVLLAWPVVGLILGLVVLKGHGQSIRLFLERMCTLKVGNVVEMSAQRPSKQETPTDKEKQILDAWTASEMGRLQAEQDKNQLLQVLQNVQLQAAFWEFQYLNLFLVPKTKLILGILTSSQPHQTLQTFMTLWPHWQCGDEKERDAVLSALMNNSLIEQQDGRLMVTQKGLVFLQFIQQTASQP